MSALGREIERLREAKHWRQEDLGRAMGHKGKGTVSKWETGAITPQLPTLTKLAAALDCSVRHLLSFGAPFDPHGPRNRRATKPVAIDTAIGSGNVSPEPLQHRPTLAPIGAGDEPLVYTEDERVIHTALHAALAMDPDVMRRVRAVIGAAIHGGPRAPKAARHAGAGRKHTQSLG